MKQTIVFIGDAGNWQGWSDWFAQRGFESHVATFGPPPDARQAPPSGADGPTLADALSAVRREAVRHVDPVLVGHAIGGLVVQLLVNEGMGVAGVAMCPVPPNNLSGDAGRIDFAAPHAPLLLIAAGQDTVVPPEVCERQAAAYTDAGSVVTTKTFAHRSHAIVTESGWQDVAAYVFDWITAHVAPQDAPGSEPRPSPWHTPG